MTTICRKCKAEVQTDERGALKTHGRYIIGSKHGFYACSASGTKPRTPRTKLGNRIQKALRSTVIVGEIVERTAGDLVVVAVDGERAYAQPTYQTWIGEQPQPFQHRRDSGETVECFGFPSRVVVELSLSGVVLPSDPFQGFRNPCGRCGKGEAAGAAGLCRECNELPDEDSLGR